MTSFKKNLFYPFVTEASFTLRIRAFCFVSFVNSFIEDIIHTPYSSPIQSVPFSVFNIFTELASVTTFNFRTLSSLPRETPHP